MSTLDVEPQTQPSSETQVLSEIVTWANSCTMWQRDALRRL